MEKTWYPKEYKGYCVEELMEKLQLKMTLTADEDAILSEICDNYSKKQKKHFEELTKNKRIHCIEVCGFVEENSNEND